MCSHKVYIPDLCLNWSGYESIRTDTSNVPFHNSHAAVSSQPVTWNSYQPVPTTPAPVTPVKEGLGTGLFSCYNCGKQYPYRHNLQRHIRDECGKEPKFACPFCPHRTKQKANLQSHVRRIHSTELPTYSVPQNQWRMQDDMKDGVLQ